MSVGWLAVLAAGAGLVVARPLLWWAWAGEGRGPVRGREAWAIGPSRRRSTTAMLDLVRDGRSLCGACSIGRIG